jgi:anaerobic ribonucleoside-triphosphate reductase
MQDFNIKCTVRKRNGTQDSFDINKILTGIDKSAQRSEPNFSKLTDEERGKFISALEQLFFTYNIKNGDTIETAFIEKIVGTALGKTFPTIQKTYQDYNNWKSKYADAFCKVKSEIEDVYLRGDRSNANTNSAYVSTKRCLGYNIFNKEMYQMNFLTPQELKVCRDGYIYIHDMVARNDTFNCMLFRMEDVMSGGFEMGDMWYTEPKTLDVAFDVMLAITKTAAAQQYGGFTIPRVDTLLAKYAEKSYNNYIKEYNDFAPVGLVSKDLLDKLANRYAKHKVQRDLEQGFQAVEYDLNTIGSSRGDYPFVTMTFGLDTSNFGKMVSKAMCKVRANGEGKEGNKKIVAFPKLVSFYDENLHGTGKECEDVYNAVVECQSKAMYPDIESLTGEGYVPSIYKKYHLAISPMGCASSDEVVNYKLNGIQYVESFGRFWNRISSLCASYNQPGLDERYRYIDTSNIDLVIYDTVKGFVKVKKLVRNYSEEWYRVCLKNGRNVTVTGDHPFETENRGVVYAKELTNEDYIRININCETTNTVDYPIDKAWFLGFMLCDGCYQNYSVFASIAEVGEDEIEERFVNVVKKYYGLDVKTVIQHRGIKGNYKDLRIKSDGSRALQYLINSLTESFGGINKINRQIPNEVFRWTREAKIAFLAGMIDADGYIVHSKYRNYPNTVAIGSTNRELAVQQMMLAQSLGMPGKMYINYYRKGSTNVRHRVEFCGLYELKNYIACAKKYINLSENVSMPVYDDIVNVMKISTVDMADYSYDVETESGHFEFSGIYSHNCRAFLSPWFERGGMHPADDDDVPVFEGRANIGAISLNLPMIYQQSVEEHRDFYENLDMYLEMIRNLHQRTYEFLGKLKAGCNPMVFCQGGAYGGHLQPNDLIAPVIKSWTASFGITALNELQVLYNGKTIVEDGEFALEVLQHINDKVNKFKELDGHLYAIYSTPAEALCGTQVKQFRKKYGIIKGVSDKEYFTNSTHCPVYANITPFEKQDLEKRFWDLSNGGHIQYVRHTNDQNLEAFDTINKRAMKMGFYFGHNMDKCYCEDCGHEELDMKVCPKCGSKNITEINRVCGYLGYSKIKGDSRMNDAKLAEIADRVSM